MRIKTCQNLNLPFLFHNRTKFIPSSSGRHDILISPLAHLQNKRNKTTKTYINITPPCELSLMHLCIKPDSKHQHLKSSQCTLSLCTVLSGLLDSHSGFLNIFSTNEAFMLRIMNFEVLIFTLVGNF